MFRTPTFGTRLAHNHRIFCFPSSQCFSKAVLARMESSFLTGVSEKGARHPVRFFDTHLQRAITTHWTSTVRRRFGKRSEQKEDTLCTQTRLLPGSHYCFWLSLRISRFTSCEPKARINGSTTRHEPTDARTEDSFEKARYNVPLKLW